MRGEIDNSGEVTFNPREVKLMLSSHQSDSSLLNDFYFGFTILAESSSVGLPAYAVESPAMRILQVVAQSSVSTRIRLTRPRSYNRSMTLNKWQIKYFLHQEGGRQPINWPIF